MTCTKIQNVQRKIAAVREKIALIDDIRPGAATKQKRSARGKIYAEYWYVTYAFRGRGHTEYVPEWAVKDVQRENKNFKRLLVLIDEWTELAIELSKLRIDEQRRGRRSSQKTS